MADSVCMGSHVCDKGSVPLMGLSYGLSVLSRHRFHAPSLPVPFVLLSPFFFLVALAVLNSAMHISRSARCIVGAHPGVGGRVSRGH